VTPARAAVTGILEYNISKTGVIFFSRGREEIYVSSTCSEKHGRGLIRVELLRCLGLLALGLSEHTQLLYNQLNLLYCLDQRSYIQDGS